MNHAFYRFISHYWKLEVPSSILIKFLQHAGLFHFPRRILICPSLSLYLRDDKDFELYQTNILNQLEFSWRGFKVNGTDMRKIKSTGTTDMDDLNEFTFLSPVLDLQADILMEDCSVNVNETITGSEVMQYLNFRNMNYGYIAGVILIIIMALELRMKIPTITERWYGKRNEHEVEESEYETMENLETRV